MYILNELGLAYYSTINMILLIQGSIFPCCYAIMRHWAIPGERSIVGSFVLSGRIYLTRNTMSL